MRFVVIIGVVMLGLFGAAFALNWRSAAPEAPVLVALETTLERPLVIYADGTVPEGIRSTLVSLDVGTGALAGEAAPRTLIDLDTYVMVRDNWDAFRGLEGHDLSTLIHERTANKTDQDSLTWFDAMLTSPQGADRRVLVILATDQALANMGEFCFALTVYEMARFAQNGASFTKATTGPGSQWKQCSARGWRSVADLPGFN